MIDSDPKQKQEDQFQALRAQASQARKIKTESKFGFNNSYQDAQRISNEIDQELEKMDKTHCH